MSDGSDQLGPGQVELAAQVADVPVDDADVAAEVVPPDVVQDLALRQHTARVQQEEPQQGELRRRELDGAAATDDLVTSLVEGYIPEAENVAHLSFRYR
jgi:hypothetical protein